MKKYLYILMLTTLMSGCMNESKVNKQEMEPSSTVAHEADEVEKQQVAVLKENAIYETTMVDGDKSYEVYISSNQDDSNQYSFFVAEENGKLAYSQELAYEKFNKNNIYSLNTNKQTLIILSLEKSEEVSSLRVISMDQGILREVPIEGGELLNLTDRKLKSLSQNILQSAYPVNQNESIFRSWELQKDPLVLSLYDEATVTEDSGAYQSLLDQSWMDIWSETEEVFYPYENIELTKEVIERAKMGIPMGGPYPIGTNIEDIKKSNPYYIQEGILHGQQYLMYPETIYYYNREDGAVSTVAIPGERLQSSLADLKKLLGDPVNQEEEDGLIYSEFLADKYVLKTYTNESGEIKQISLSKQ